MDGDSANYESSLLGMLSSLLNSFTRTITSICTCCIFKTSTCIHEGATALLLPGRDLGQYYHNKVQLMSKLMSVAKLE